MELRHLRYFVAVAEELHFSRAAGRLHMAQPPLSQQIRRLEQELGVALFNRTKRRVELTPAGRAFLEEARRVLEQAERAARTAQRAGRGEVGRLAIGLVPSADLDILPRVLRAWGARFPHVEIELHALLPAAQVEALLEGRIQVGFVRLPIEENGLVVESIQREPLLAALPERHRLARRTRVRLADLAGDTMLLFPRHIAPGYHDVFIGACRRAGFTPRVLHPGSMQTNLALVSAGLGVSLLPASIRNLRRAGVVYRPLAPPVPQVEMAVAYRRGERSAVLPAFLQVLYEVVRRGRRRRADLMSASPLRGDV
jgi:DNA-binding transcriptional LysR family regulator